jgi:hypothetical protein
MLRLAAEERVSVLSFFWNNQLFAYLDQAPDLERLPDRAANQRFAQAVFAAMQKGQLSATGEFLRERLRSR